MSGRINNKKGFLLISMLSFTIILSLIIIPLISWSVNEYKWTSRSYMSLQALNLADAGAESAIWEIAYNNELFTSWSGTNPKTITITSFKDGNNRTIGDITVSADKTSASHYTITSTGFVPNASNPIATKTVKVFLLPKVLFNNAVFGNTSVTLSGITLVDSYLAPYSALTARENGDIGTNNILKMVGAATVKGDALVAPGGSATGVESRITGELFYASDPAELDPVALPDCFDGVPVSPDIKLPGGTATLPSGNYRYEEIDLSSDAVLTINSDTNIYISESIAVTASARINTGANVAFYISGDANFAGQGIVNTSGVPSNLQIYGIGSTTTIDYSGGSDFYGVIYAPECDVSTGGNSSIYGAIVGNVVTLGGTGALHYDESLSDNGPAQGYTIIYWQEN